MWYIGIIVLANIVIMAAHLLASDMTAVQSCLYPAAATVSVIAVDGIEAFLIRRLPERFFCAEKTADVSELERKLYRKLKIKVWKSKVPELGGFTGFHKDRLKTAADKEYLARFLLESNYGTVIHIVNALTGFVIAVLPFCGPVSVTVPVAAVNCLLNLAPAAILRYNTPALKRAYKRAR